MAGSPSQLELFEHKPALQKLHLQDCPPSFLEGKRFAFIRGVPKILAGQFNFRQYGQSGQWISELLPEFAEVSDRACVIRTMQTDQFNHAPSQLFIHTGSPDSATRRSVHGPPGGWDPAIRICQPSSCCCPAAKRPMPASRSGAPAFSRPCIRGSTAEPLAIPCSISATQAAWIAACRRRMLDAIAEMNAAEFARSGDPETQTRIAQYELAFRMQATVPEVMDLSREPKHILDLYGAQPGYVSPAESADDPRVLYRGDDPTFANNCLLARRLVEAGVRFVQLYDWGWDHHGSSPGESIDETLPIKCQAADRAMAALIRDLEQRGLLDETLIVWGGEFGRTPMMQNNVRSELKKGFVGRDHHPHAFTMWLAGGGIRGGLAWGQTDEFGYYPVENPVTVRDLQATILHLLGLDPYRFSYLYQGLENRLIGPTDEGRVLHGILA
jgi:hypothetical protein